MKAQKVVSVILALTLMMSMVPAAFAVELENPNDIFSEEYFAYVAKEDGNPYDVDEDISVAYQSDPVQFMNQLGKIDPMYKDFYIRTLVSVAYNEFDWEGFKSQILSLSVEDSSVINQLYAYAIQFEEEEHAWEEYYKDWKNRPQAEGRFNPDIVLEAITSHAEAYTFDMEYCDYLRAMHQLDPNLFIRTISDLSKEEIQLIATQIRYAQKNKRSINTSNIAGNSTVCSYISLIQDDEKIERVCDGISVAEVCWGLDQEIEDIISNMREFSLSSAEAHTVSILENSYQRIVELNK